MSALQAFIHPGPLWWELRKRLNNTKTTKKTALLLQGHFDSQAPNFTSHLCHAAWMRGGNGGGGCEGGGGFVFVWVCVCACRGVFVHLLQSQHFTLMWLLSNSKANVSIAELVPVLSPPTVLRRDVVIHPNSPREGIFSPSTPALLANSVPSIHAGIAGKLLNYLTNTLTSLNIDPFNNDWTNIFFFQFCIQLSMFHYDSTPRATKKLLKLS